MKPRIFFISLIAIIITFGLIIPDGIRAAAANNAWSIFYIQEAAQAESLNPLDFAPPSSHRHAGMLLAHQALKGDNIDLAWFYLAPLTADPDLLILETQANIHFLTGEFVSAIYIWKDLGNYSRLYTAASSLNEDDHLDEKILALRNAYEIRGSPYDRLFISNSMQKADLLLEDSQYEEAFTIYRALIEEFPQDPRPYSELAQAYWLNNQPNLALAAIEQGWDINAGNSSYYITAAQYYEALGRIEEALGAYQTALQINPDHHDALQGLEQLKEVDE